MKVAEQDEPPVDYETTQSMLQRKAPGVAWIPGVFRDRMSPTAVVSVLVAFATFIGVIGNAQHNLHDAQRDIHQLHDTVTELILELKKRDDLAHSIDIRLGAMDGKLGVMENKIDNVTDRINEQRQWRANIEHVAGESRNRRRH